MPLCLSRRAINPDLKGIWPIRSNSRLERGACRIFCLFSLLISLFLIQELVFLQPVMAEDDSVLPGAFFRFLYIDANVGGSSGGHTGLHIGHTVYHFQYFPDGFFRLVRDRWPHFRYIYNDLENRTIYAASVDVTASDLSRIREHFDQYYLVQEAHMARLDVLNADAQLLDDFSHGIEHMALNGAGLFSQNEPPDDISNQLRAAITKKYGAEYLDLAIQSLARALVVIPLVVTEAPNSEISREVYPGSVGSPWLNYAENRLKHTALVVLKRALPVREAELMDMDAFSRPGDPKELSEDEQRNLSSYAENLKKSAMALASSRRPDWGYALLLTAARYQAVMRSLKYNRLFLLDPFPDAALKASAKSIQDDPGVTARLADRARRGYWRIRQEILSGKPLDERNYNRLEESAGRYAELEKGRTTGKPIRVAYGGLIPSRSDMVPLPPPAASPQLLMQSLSAARVNLESYREKLEQCYPYHLIESNCATELIRNLNAPFESKSETVHALGGYIEPNGGFNFIPSYLFNRVNGQFRVKGVVIVPGFRKRMLTQMEEVSKDDAVVYLRECNTLTSTLYNGMEGDTPFLFFTDNVTWIRPVYGALNTAYGMLAAGAGIFSLPMDGGGLISRGLKGALYSLPELFFCNIRKGSFNYVDDSANPETDHVDRSAPAFDRRGYP